MKPSAPASNHLFSSAAEIRLARTTTPQMKNHTVVQRNAERIISSNDSLPANDRNTWA